MNKEELILEIIEKVYDKSKETDRKVEELSKEVAAQRTLHEKNSVVLEEHMRRTEANETQIDYVKKHVVFVNSVIKVIGGIGAVVLFFVKVLPFLHSVLGS